MWKYNGKQREESFRALAAGNCRQRAAHSFTPPPIWFGWRATCLFTFRFQPFVLSLDGAAHAATAHRIYARVWAYICTYIYIYAYIYIRTRTHTHTPTYIYITRESSGTYVPGLWNIHDNRSPLKSDCACARASTLFPVIRENYIRRR